jgi:hypothetical protein
MQVTAFYKDINDYQSFVNKITRQDIHEDIVHYKSQNKIVIEISAGAEDDAENFFIAERFRGRKLVIDA